MSIIQEAQSRINQKVLLAGLALPIALFMAIAITEVKWVYMALLIAPFIIYISLKKTFIFPFGLYVFSIPFEGLQTWSGAEQGATLMRVIGIMTILSLLLKSCFEKKLRAPDKTALWWLLFALYCLLSITWSISPDSPIVRAQTIIGLLALYMVVSSYKIQKKEYDILKWFVLLSGILSALIMLYCYQKGMNEFGDATRVSVMSLNDKGVNGANRDLFEGSEGDKGIHGANKQAFDMLIAVSICLGMMLKERKLSARLLLFLALMTMFCGIILTGSRGGLAAGLTVVLYYCLFTKKKMKFGIFAAVTAITVFSFIPQYYIDRISDSVESNASGRGDIWQVGLQAIKKYWLFGAGLDGFPKAYTEFVKYTPRFLGLDRAPHNVIIGMSVELGIVGLAVMVIGLAKHYSALGRESRTCNMDRIVLKAAFWGIMVSGMSLDMIWNKTFWLLLMMMTMQKYISEVEKKNVPLFAQSPEYHGTRGVRMIKAGQ